MTAHDYLAEAESCWANTDAPEDWVNITTRTAALLGIGQQLRRIADLMEQSEPVACQDESPKPVDPVTGTNVPAYVNDADYGASRVRAYLAREGRL